MKHITTSLFVFLCVFQVVWAASGTKYFVKSTILGPEPSCGGIITESSVYLTGFCIPQSYGGNITFYEKLECTTADIIFHKYKDPACTEKLSQEPQHLGCNHGTKFSCENTMPSSKDNDRVRVYYKDQNCVKNPFQVVFYYSALPSDNGCATGICRGLTDSLSFREGCGLNFDIDTFGRNRNSGSNTGTIIIIIAIVLVFVAIIGVGAAFLYKRYLDRRDSEKRSYMRDLDDDDEELLHSSL